MPPRRPRKNVKSRTFRRKSKPKFARKSYRKAGPRRIRTSPASAPNTYLFKRSYNYSINFGIGDAVNTFMNTDNKYMVIKLATQFNRLPDYTEFNALFSEYKIRHFTQTFTPYYKINQAQLLTPSTDATLRGSIPNYEIVAVPVNYTDDFPGLELKTKDEIDSYLNQSQRKSRRLIPSGRQVFKTMKPKVARFVGATNKDMSAATGSMGPPVWYTTAAPGVGAGDERAVMHYGVQLLIRRVDGGAIAGDFTQAMGGRMTTDVTFNCRKVQ